MLIEHKPDGDPCRRCGEPARRHRRPRKRAWHVAKGSPCRVCGRPAARHPGPARIAKRAAYDAARPRTGPLSSAQRSEIAAAALAALTPDQRRARVAKATRVAAKRNRARGRARRAGKK